MEKCHGKHRLAIDFFVFISYIWRNIKRKSNDRIYKELAKKRQNLDK